MSMDSRELMTFARDELREMGRRCRDVSPLPGAVIPAQCHTEGRLGMQLFSSQALLVGLHIFCLAIARQRYHAAGQLFEGFTTFANGLVAYILTLIFIFLWSLLLIVPGIMAAFSYAMTFFILTDDRTVDGLEAIRRSKAMMYGHGGGSAAWWEIHRVDTARPGHLRDRLPVGWAISHGERGEIL